MKLRNLLRGTPAHRPLTPAHPLDDDVVTRVSGETFDQLVASLDELDTQCTAITTKRTRCKFDAKPGSDKCATHAKAKM